MNTKKHPLTNDAKAKLREWITSPEGRQVMMHLQSDEPMPVHESDHPCETMAISGGITAGWKRCIRKLYEYSEPPQERSQHNNL